jgi:PEP-CTERM motif
MKSLLLTAALLALAAPAYAATSFHVTGSLASGSDPVLLNENTSFEILDNENGTAIDSPLTIYFAVPVGETGPSVTSYDFDGGAFHTTGISLASLGVWDPGGSTHDLYSFVGCSSCNNSINEANVDFVDGVGTKFNVLSLTLNQAFGSKGDDEVIDGLFGLGTIIAPLALDAKGHFADTSWTNAGFVNGLSTPTPEPSIWAMMLLGVGLIGAGLRMARRKVGMALTAT